MPAQGDGWSDKLPARDEIRFGLPVHTPPSGDLKSPNSRSGPSNRKSTRARAERGARTARIWNWLVQSYCAVCELPRFKALSATAVPVADVTPPVFGNVSVSVCSPRTIVTSR